MSPQRYPLIPTYGTTKTINAILSIRETELLNRVVFVFPRPFKMLDSVPDK